MPSSSLPQPRTAFSPPQWEPFVCCEPATGAKTQSAGKNPTKRRRMHESSRGRPPSLSFRRCHLDSRTCRAVLRILSHCAELETCVSPSPPRPFLPLPGPSEQDRSAASDGAAAALGGSPGEDGCGLGEGRNRDGCDRHGETAGSDDLDDGSQGHGKVPTDGLVDGCPGVVRAHVENSPLVEGIGVCDVREEVFDYSRNVAYQKEQSCVDVILSGSLDDLSVDFSGLLEELGLQEGEGEGKDGPTYDGLEKEQPSKDAGSFGLGEACPRADVPDHGAGRQGRTIIDGSLGNESTVVDGLPDELFREEPGLLSVQSENPHPVGESCREAQLKVCDSFRLSTDDSGLERLDGHHKDRDMCTVQENEMEEGEIPNEGEVLDFSFDMEFQNAAKGGNQLEESHLADDTAEEGNATGVLCALTAAGTSSGAGLIEEDLGKTVHESDQIVGRKELKPQKKKKSDEGTKKVKGKVKKKMDLSNSDKQLNDKKGLEHQKKAKSAFGTKVSISENIVSGCWSLAEVSSKETMVESEEKPSSTGDVKVQQKRKRAPLTENRKEKIKLSKKRKRAEKNRKLGVKRLKLEMISKPKKVVHCSFYQKGRCQKGDSCKFSHDMIPDTKSTPCTFFARGICLKGDDCPFDHQLSKYPCHTYISQGSCSRGDSCLFSHKIPAGEPSSSISVTRQTDSKMLSGNQSRENLLSTSVINTSLNTTKSTNKSMPKDSVEQIKKQPPKMPKGICFLSFGKETPIHINEKPDDLKKCDGIQVQKQGEKIIPGKLQNANENLHITPVERLSRRTSTSMVNEVNPLRLLQNPPLLVQQNVEIKSCGSAQSLASNTTTTNGSKDSINSGSRVTDASRILEEFLFTGIH